ncbi:Retroelement pol Polyprotein [Phytophthora cinnamomi]|uniref:Retroelement pol Polyprotein n=1 Tax=Phytophthora cinnamomi TaxID=4785 RepID=UPI0035595ED4|nr:Retroelement pol Polyprotein [Phytophthora cinnamomi]
MAKRNAPKYNNSGGNQGRKPRMNMVLEDDEQVDTVVMDRVTMSVADIQEQADELQAFMDNARVQVEETVTAASEMTEYAGSCGLQPVEEPSLHAMQPELESGVCGSPPEQEAELHEKKPVKLVKQGSQPTSTTETLKVNAVKSERLASNVLLSRRLQAQRFDGTLTPATDVKHVEAPVSMDGYFFSAIESVERKLPESHDVILGKPWFKDYNPQVDWQKEEVVIPDRMQFIDVDAPSFSHNLKEGEYEQVFRVKIQLVPEVEGIPEPIFNVVGKEFNDMFPEQLPDGLPPMREVNFEVTLKKGAQPSFRAPFSMSKMEQDAFEEFVKDKLKKGWIEESNSPWVSNIFAIPKKDPVTGQMPKRAEWLRSGNLKIPLRWVFDYRYLNSVTVIAKIPLPLIEELFDKMVGCVIYTLIDLAQGYHQMLVVKSRRPYTAFRTHKETYQWCVAPMGVAGMPGTWSRLMHKLFDKYEFVVVYLDDICVFLKLSERFDAILVAVDKLSKRVKYAPTYSTADAKDTAKVYFDAVVRHHGLPKVIISDRDSKFISDFWKSLMKLMGIKLSMTTAHRAQADGQTERQNLVLEDALRCMISYHGDDWVKHLGTIEYAHSTLVNASTKFAPFELDTGRKVSNIVAEEMKDLLQSENDVTLAEFAKNFAKERQEIVERAQKNLEEAQARQNEYYDRKRRQVVFKRGDLVLLDTKNLPLKTVNKNTELKKAKLAATKVGPFVLERMVNDNVAKLILPRTMKRLNPTFNVELLTHYQTNREDFPNRPIPKAVPLILDEDTGEELYIVEKLLKKRTRRRNRQWLVKWHGLPEHKATWESEAQIKHVSHWRQLLDEYRLRQREVNQGEMSGPPLAC